mmetsp:Transcript_11739/g.19755  ORF Transcript_11739/g.19755 Transcript_11739/m.19755 type:complete len:445 (+) Transcript_11739:62-1396(+)
MLPIDVGAGTCNFSSPLSACLAVDASAKNISVDLLVLIMTRPGLEGAARRAALRKSWAIWKPPCSVLFRFMLGRLRKSNETSHVRLRSRRNDIVQLPVTEGYATLSRKVLLAMRWAHTRCSFRFLLKTDDDSYVCIGGLLRWLHTLSHHSSSSISLYAGVRLAQRCAGKELIPLFQQLANTNLVDPKCRRGWRFPPDTMHGAGYLLSADLVARVVMLFTSLLPVPSAEDITISLLLHWNAFDRTLPHQPLMLPSAARRQTLKPNGTSRQLEVMPLLAWNVTFPPFTQAAIRLIGVLPFASRVSPWRLAEAKPSLRQQQELVRKRCRQAAALVLHKLTAEQIITCNSHKEEAAAGCGALKNKLMNATLKRVPMVRPWSETTIAYRCQQQPLPQKCIHRQRTAWCLSTFTNYGKAAYFSGHLFAPADVDFCHRRIDLKRVQQLASS